MKLFFTDDFSAVSEGYEILSKVLGFDICEGGASVRLQKIESGHGVFVDEGGIRIEYSTVAGAMRALTRLVHHLQTEGENKPLSVREQEVFQTCGTMIDVSLGDTVPKTETWKRFLSYMARMGLNMLMIYTEDIYELKKYPYFGYMRGAYTVEEFREVVDYAQKLGIEVIPCIQTLAHLGKVQRWKANAPLFDTANVLMIDDERTYVLIEEMIATARRAFSTKRIHIGMDEAHGVCMGKYYEKHGPTNRYEALLRHLNRVVEICRKYDFAPMMWSDMFFRLGSKTNDYYDITAEMPANIKQTIPVGVSQVYWDYYHTNKETYRKLLLAHQAMGDVTFAGGIWTWTGFAPRYRQTMESTVPALEICREHGVNHIFATVWNSDYSECDFFNALFGLQVYAEYNAGGAVTMERLEKAFRIYANMNANAFLAMDIDDFGEDYPQYDYSAPYSFSEVEHCIPVISKQAFSQDPLIGLFDKNFSYLDLKSHFSCAYQRLAQYKAEGEEGELLAIATAYAKVVCGKCDLGIRMKTLYDGNDKKGLEALLPEIDEMIATLEHLHEIYSARYYRNNKPFGFEERDMRFGGIRARLYRAKARISDFLAGKIERIEELEAERLTFENRESPFAHLYYIEKMRRP